MKFVFSDLNEPILFEENVINSLIIENQNLFMFLIDDLYRQINGESGVSVLSSDDSPIEIKKNVELISSFVPFELNKRSLIGKIISALEKTSVDEEFYLRTVSLLSEIERYIEDISFELPCHLECEKLTVQSLCKAVELRLSGEKGNTLDNIIDYMELVREFENDKLFVFVNMRSYYSDSQMESFTETVISRKFRILLVDGHEHKRLCREKRLIIDKDLCEI